jgi:hypothetical protein
MKKLFNRKFGWIYLLTCIVLVNVLASYVNLRFDMTSEKRFTLSLPVREMLQRVHDQVNIDILLKGHLKSGLRKLRNSTEELLQDSMSTRRKYSLSADRSRCGVMYQPGDYIDSLSEWHTADDPGCPVKERGRTKPENCYSRCYRQIRDRQLPVDLLKGVQRSREGQRGQLM